MQGIEEIAESVEPPTDTTSDESGQSIVTDDPLGEPAPTGAGESESVLSRLTEPLEGSIYEQDIGELWNPDAGAENRVLLVAQEATGFAEGLPRAVHAGIGLAEMYVKHASDGEASEQDDADPGEPNVEAAATASSDTKEVLEYDG